MYRTLFVLVALLLCSATVFADEDAKTLFTRGRAEAAGDDGLCVFGSDIIQALKSIMQMQRNQHKPYPDGIKLESVILFLFHDVPGRTQQAGLTRSSKVSIIVTGWTIWFRIRR